MYWIRRHKYNPLKYIFGDCYLSNNYKKWLGQLVLDTKDIKIITKKTKKTKKSCPHYKKKWKETFF
jgi:hypothetical protein